MDVVLHIPIIATLRTLHLIYAMSRFWPHPAYAEEQPLAKTILYTHTLTRGLTTGTILGPIIASPIYALRQLNILSPKALSLPLSYTTLLLRSSTNGAIIGTLILIPLTMARMWGREDIEWKDRAWRLLENKGQKECDDWTYAGSIAGAIAASTRRGQFGVKDARPWRATIGGAGIGSVLGMVGYMGYRYGMKGGKFEEVEP